MNGFAFGELSRAFLTAAVHEDPETRRRADRRTAAWIRTIAAMATGRVALGSRAPVAGLPAWVTLEVLRGGFATGAALAEGDLEPDEIALAGRAGVPPERLAIFGHLLTEPGLAELDRLLDERTVRVDLPEDAALLVLAWLVRQGERTAALDLLEALTPMAGRLRFAPRRATAASPPADHVFRLTASEARQVLEARRPDPQVEAQREAVTVWNPFADRLLDLWWQRFDASDLDLAVDDTWRAAATRLLEEYEELATLHTRCGKHRRPKENLTILLASTRDVVAGRGLDHRRAGLLRTALTAMVAKRGAPGSTDLQERRASEKVVVRLPPHAVLARVAADRLADVEQTSGLEDPSGFVGPVTPAEAGGAVPVGAAMPPVVRRTLGRARSAPVEVLIETGVVPSAEVLAGLIPRLSAGVVARSYADETLGWLMSLTYAAFRRRRSLLLVDLAQQVQLHELPWVRAVEAFRAVETGEELAVVRRVGALALDHFPGTVLPNPLVRELDHLMRAAGLDVPLTEELAADIFMGEFSPKFTRAAAVAGRLLEGSLYARYFDLPDPGAWQAGPTDGRRRPGRSRAEGDRFAALCLQRAGTSAAGSSVAANGTVIEQAQILTTHDLAALVVAGVRPTRPWAALADDATRRCWDLLRLAQGQRRPLAAVKDAAYAWRQALFFASMLTAEQAGDWARSVVPPDTVTAGPALVGGLRHVGAGGRFDLDGRCPGGRRFLGWTTSRPWVLDPPGGGREDSGRR